MADTEVNTADGMATTVDAPAPDSHSVAVREHADVLARMNPDTAAEVPSAAWGWSGEYRKAFTIGGWVIVLCLLAMLRGNHVGNVENIYLIAFAALLAVILVRDSIRSRRPH